MKSLSNTTKLALLIFCVIAIAMRFVGHMNLQAVGALAIFSGAVISPLWLAMIVPVAVMLVSDLAGIGFHWQTASLVYPSYMLAVFLARQWVSGWRDSASGGPHQRKPEVSVLQIAGSTFAGAALFYLITNFGAWAMMPNFYPDRSLTGILESYRMGLPFFRSSLAGGFVFVTVFFAMYALMTSRVDSRAQLADENS